MSEMAYPEDAAGHNIAAEESQEISPDDLEITSLPDISVISGAADDDDDAEVAAAAATRSTGCNSNKGAKMGVALLALSAIVFSAVIFGTSNTNKGPPPSLSSSSKIAQAIEVEPTMKPTPMKPRKPLKVEKIDDAKTSAPTKAKVTKQPATKPPKPAPLKETPFPTEEATNQVTETVSTETTGPPTVAARNETRV